MQNKITYKSYIAVTSFVIIITFLIIFFLKYKEEKVILGITPSVNETNIFKELLTDFEKKTSVKLNIVVGKKNKLLEMSKNGKIDVVLSNEIDDEEYLKINNKIKQISKIMYNHYLFISADNFSFNEKEKSLEEILEYLSATDNKIILNNKETENRDFENKILSNFFSNIHNNSDNFISLNPQKNILDAVLKGKHSAFVDKLTWVNYNNKGNLSVLAENDNYLVNQYKAIVFDQNNDERRIKNANKLISWLVNKDTQKLIDSYKINNQQIFFANAKIHWYIKQ